MRLPAFKLIVGILLTASAAASLLQGQAQQKAGVTRALLWNLARVDDDEWAGVERGEAIAKVLDTDSREIALVGAIRIAAPSERLLARVRDVDNLKRSAVVVDAGRFAATPQPADLARVPFEDYSLDLRNCQPLDCRVRLAEADIARFHREVNWQAADWRDRSRAVWRHVLAGYAGAYATRGREALPVYANKREPLSVASELSLLVRQFDFLDAFSPAFLGYLRMFGPAVPEGAEQTLYWSKEDFGIRPVVRISHQVIVTPPGGASILIATNQVYADHYLDAALNVTMAIDAPDAARGRAFHMVVVSRARTRSLSGLFRSFVRSTVQGRSRDALRKILTATKTNLERQ